MDYKLNGKLGDILMAEIIEIIETLVKHDNMRMLCRHDGNVEGFVLSKDAVEALKFYGVPK